MGNVRLVRKPLFGGEVMQRIYEKELTGADAIDETIAFLMRMKQVLSWAKDKESFTFEIWRSFNDEGEIFQPKEVSVKQ